MCLSTAGVKSSWYIGRECVQAMGEKVGSVLQTESTDDLKGLLMNRTVSCCHWLEWRSGH